MTTGAFSQADLAFSLPSRGEATGLSSLGLPEGADGFDHFDPNQRTSKSDYLYRVIGNHYVAASSFGGLRTSAVREGGREVRASAAGGPAGAHPFSYD